MNHRFLDLPLTEADFKPDYPHLSDDELAYIFGRIESDLIDAKLNGEDPLTSEQIREEFAFQVELQYG